MFIGMTVTTDQKKFFIDQFIVNIHIKCVKKIIITNKYRIIN